MQAFFCAFWPKLISAKMAKLISETVKLISEMAKLISADPKSHFFGNFHCFLYYLHQTLTQNVQKSYNIGQILSKKG